MSLPNFRPVVFAFVLIGISSFAGIAAAQNDAAKNGPITPAAIKEVLAKPTRLEFTGSIFAATEAIQAKTQLPVRLDRQALAMLGMMPDVPMILQPGDPLPGPNPMTHVSFKSNNEKLDKVLRRGLMQIGLTYVVLEDGVLITTDTFASARILRQRVGVQVVDQPCVEALRDLAKRTGVAIVIDPRHRKQADAKVSLELENIALDAGVRLLAELADLKAVWMYDVLFVTSPDRAMKIRQEEMYRQDGLGGFGGMGYPIDGGGGISMPFQGGVVRDVQVVPEKAVAPLKEDK